MKSILTLILPAPWQCGQRPSLFQEREVIFTEMESDRIV